MRIVRRSEFLALPANTLYRQALGKWSWGPVSVKYDTLISEVNPAYSDFVCQALDDPENNSGEQLIERYEAMVNEGTSFPLETDMAGRDGLFEQEAFFMVFEKDDLVRLRAEIDDCIAAI